MTIPAGWAIDEPQEDQPEWLTKKPKLPTGWSAEPAPTNAASQPHSLDSLSADIAKARAALPTTGQIIGRGIEAGATGLGDVLNTASAGAYHGLRHIIGDAIAPDATAEMEQGENAVHNELQKTTTGQLLEGTSNAIGNVAGAPEMAARAIGTGIETAATAGPAALRTVLASRPVAGALTGAGTNAALTAGQDVAGGASLKDTLHDVGESAAMGGAVGGTIGLGSAAIDKVAGKINNSRGAEARRFIEEHGKGATVSPLTPGKGGVFADELAGLPANDKGIGSAAKIGATNVLDTLEAEHLAERGVPYREGKTELKDATSRARQKYAEDKQAAREELLDARRAARDVSRERAGKITDSIREQHAVETSQPYRVMKAVIDSSPDAAQPRDVAPIVASMQDAVHDLETAPMVRAQLNEQLAILERYRDPTTDAVMVPERQINGLRRTLMRSAKVGMTDAPGEKEAPLRAAAFAAKQMVDEGPYAALNKFYAEGAKRLEKTRASIGLKRKTGPDAAAENARVAGILRKSIDDPALTEKFIRDNTGPSPTASPREYALSDPDIMEAEAVPEAIDTASEPKTAQIQNPNWPTTPDSPEVGQTTPVGRARIIQGEPATETIAEQPGIAKKYKPNNDDLTFIHDQNPEDSVGDHRVIAMKNGQEVGSADFVWKTRGPEDYSPMPNGQMFVSDVEVKPAHRRQGIASKIYAEAERELGKKTVPGIDQTALGKKLWEKGSPADQARAKVAASEAMQEPTAPAVEVSSPAPGSKAAKQKLEFVHVSNPEDGVGEHRIIAMRDGKEVGFAEFEWNSQGALNPDSPMPKGKMFAATVNVDPAYRRQGIASDIYAEAEKKLGKTIVPGDRSPDGRKFWEKGSPAERSRAKAAVSEILPPTVGRARIIPDEPNVKAQSTQDPPVAGEKVDGLAAPTEVPSLPARSVNDLANLADMSDVRTRMDTARENAKAAAAQREEALYWAKARAGSNAERAAEIRQMLGLNREIGTRKTDINQTRLALQRQGQNSNTGGGSPADLEALRAARPDLAPDLDLPELQRAKADLSFHLVPHHGGLIGRTVGAAAGPTAAILATAAAHGPLGLLAAPAIMAAQNVTPIAGRVLYPLTRNIGHVTGPNPAAIARLIQASRAGATRAQLQAQADRDKVDPATAAQIIASASP